VITNADLNTVATATFKGRATAGTGNVEDLTKAQVLSLLNVADGATNYVHPSGDGNLHVPATSTTNNGKVLTAGATAGSLSWAIPPPSSTINTTSDATAGPFYPTFTSNTTGSNALKTNGSLSYVPSTGTLNATEFVGSLTGSVNVDKLKMNGAVYATHIRTHALATNVVWQADDYLVVLTNIGIDGKFALPDPTINTGRILCVLNATGGDLAVLNNDGISFPNITMNLVDGYGNTFISDGTFWYFISGR